MNENNIEETINENDINEVKIFNNIYKNIIISIFCVLPYEFYAINNFNNNLTIHYILSLIFSVISLLYLSIFKKSIRKEDSFHKIMIFLYSMPIVILIHSLIFNK